MKPTLALAASLLTLPLFAADRSPDRVSGSYETTTITTTVEAIDHDAHTVTLRDRSGREVLLFASPDLAALDRVDVGDEVTLRYALPIALQIHKVDQPVTSGSRGQTFRGSPLPPYGLDAARVTERVTIENIDPADDAITFSTEDGFRMTVTAENGSLLRDLHRGDPVEITYTTPWLVSIE